MPQAKVAVATKTYSASDGIAMNHEHAAASGSLCDAPVEAIVVVRRKLAKNVPNKNS